MTKFISSLEKGARIAAIAAVAGIMTTGSAMAASCAEEAGWQVQIQTWCDAGGSGPVCNSLPGELAACCTPPSPAEGEETCLCTALQSMTGQNQINLTAAPPAGAGVVYTCP